VVLGPAGACVFAEGETSTCRRIPYAGTVSSIIAAGFDANGMHLVIATSSSLELFTSEPE